MFVSSKQQLPIHESTPSFRLSERAAISANGRKLTI
jgi:hypothetical protein